MSKTIVVCLGLAGIVQRPFDGAVTNIRTGSFRQSSLFSLFNPLQSQGVSAGEYASQKSIATRVSRSHAGSPSNFQNQWCNQLHPG